MCVRGARRCRLLYLFLLVMAAEHPSTPPFSASSGGHLSAMQLFYELKQKFPTAPDPVVSECIRQSKHDPERCEALLRASCASRGFPAAVATSVSLASSAGRRFSAPPTGVAPSTTTSGASSSSSSSSTTDVTGATSRARSAGRNSMCALSERTSASNIGRSSNSTTTTSNNPVTNQTTPPINQSSPDTPSTNCASANNNNNNNQSIINNNNNNSNNNNEINIPCSNPRAKLRPTFLNTRPLQGKFINSNVQQELRPPFLGGPLQEPHKHQCNNNSSSNNNNSNNVGNTSRRSSLKDQKAQEHHQEYFSETYKCSVNQESIVVSPSDTKPPPRVPDWSSREPTPPPRPPLPTNMVQDPLLPPFCNSNSNRFLREEDFIQDYEVSVNCSVHGVHVTSTCSSPVSHGPIGSPMYQQFHNNQPLRHTASLHVHPTPHFLAKPASLTSVASAAASEPRSFTSVNLTLRPPSSDPQPPIDIRSASRLTYSTSSYNPRQGFQSQLHIQIGGGGGTISALRTSSQPPMGVVNNTRNNNNQPSSPCSPPPPATAATAGGGGAAVSTSSLKQHQVLVRTISLPDVSTEKQVSTTSQAGLARQMERKARLETELRRERERLNAMQREVHAMEKDLQLRQAHKAIAPLKGPSYSSMQRVEQLKAEIAALQEECKRMTQEVDLHGSQVPLGETDEEFYQNIYTGQRGFLLPPDNIPQTSHGNWSIPPRPGVHQLGREGGMRSNSVEEDEEDGPHWTCSVCTFRNHPALGKCEQCEMPRISLDVTEAETQDIHIRVTHSNFPARRVVHSWVV